MADAAAHVHDVLAARVCAGLLIALGGGALAEAGVIVEGLAGVNDRIVHCLRGEGDVIDAVRGGAGKGGALFGQTVGKELGEQRFAVDLRLGEHEGDENLLAGLSGIPKRHGLLQIEAHAPDAFRCPAGLLVVHGVHRLSENGVIDALKEGGVVFRRALGYDLDEGRLDLGVVMLGKRLPDEGTDRVGVHPDGGHALHEGDALLPHGGLGVEKLRVHGVCRAGHELCERRLVDGGFAAPRQIDAAAPAGAVGLEVFEGGAAPSIGVGLLRRDGNVGAEAELGGGDGQRVIEGEFHGDSGVFIRVCPRRLKRLRGLGHGHAADLDPVDGDIGIDRVQAGDPRGIDVDGGEDDHRDHQHGQHRDAPAQPRGTFAVPILPPLPIVPAAVGCDVNAAAGCLRPAVRLGGRTALGAGLCRRGGAVGGFFLYMFACHKLTLSYGANRRRAKRRLSHEKCLFLREKSIKSSRKAA